MPPIRIWLFYDRPEHYSTRYLVRKELKNANYKVILFVQFTTQILRVLRTNIIRVERIFHTDVLYNLIYRVFFSCEICCLRFNDIQSIGRSEFTSEFIFYAQYRKFTFHNCTVCIRNNTRWNQIHAVLSRNISKVNIFF